MNKLIVILNKDLTVQAFLNFDKEKLSLEQVSNTDQEKLEKFVQDINSETEKIKVKREVVSEDSNEYFLGLEEVSSIDPLFFQGVVDKLGELGFLANIIEDELKDLLILFSDPKIPFDQREEVMGDLLNTRGEKVTEIKNLIGEMKEMAGKIEENRNQWQDHLDKKKEEILNQIDNENT